jgi:endonuclease/exonuclease/phosphatase family metal-dependent hydrolase
MRFLLGFTLALLSIHGFVRAQSTGKQKSKSVPNGLTVMSYNVHHCNPPSAGDKIDVEAIAKVIRAESPDFVALQEIDVNTQRSGKGKNQAKLLAELTGMYSFFAKAIDHQGGEYGVAVLSRFPIMDSVRLGLSINPDLPEELRAVAAVKVVLPDGRSVMFASTHLGLKEPNRLLQAEEIVKRFGKLDLPFIIAGDFNAVPESKVISYLARFFKQTCLTDCRPTIPVEEPKKTIDFVMYNAQGNFRTLSTKVIDEKYASDHLPVVVELQ